jgi:hypothetical protein
LNWNPCEPSAMPPFRKITLVSPRPIEAQTMAHSLKAGAPVDRFS